MSWPASHRFVFLADPDPLRRMFPMHNVFPLAELHSRDVRDWLLAILRFAITLESGDRAAVLSLANALDHPGSPDGVAGFQFFARMSIDFCNAIANRGDPKRLATLRRHLKRIDDHRLRRSLQAAIEFEPA